MSIGQIGKKVVKTIRVITDADPRRVSLVANGANQTPFREVKAADVADADEKELNKETKMPKENTSKSGAELIRVTFSHDKFKNEKAVKSWMEDRGYDAPDAIETVGKSFEVKSPSFKEAEDEDVRVIEAEDGVEYHLVKWAEGTDPENDEVVAVYDAEGNDVTEKYVAEDEDAEKSESDDEAAADEQSDGEGDTDSDGDEDANADEDAEKTAEVKTADEVGKELSSKINDMRVYFSEKREMKDVLKDADDGMPIGTGDVYMLFTKALMNAAESGDTDAVKNVSSEFGEMFTEMMDVTNKFISQASSSEEDAEKSVDADEDENASKADDSQEDDAEVTEAEKADDADAETEEKSQEGDDKNSEATEKVNEEKAAESDEGEGKPTLDEQVAKAVEKALNLTTITGALKGISEKLDETLERVEDLENVEQSRKGADDELASTRTEKDTGPSRLTKNILGI